MAKAKKRLKKKARRIEQEIDALSEDLSRITQEFDDLYADIDTIKEEDEVFRTEYPTLVENLRSLLWEFDGRKLEGRADGEWFAAEVRGLLR